MTRTLLWLAGFILPLSLVGAAVYPPSCEVQANIQPQPAPVNDSIVTGPVAQSRAKQNREYIESRDGVVQLPTGEIWFDQAPNLRSGTTLQGPATLTQQFQGGNFPLNATIGAAGKNMGHVHPFTHVSRAQIRSDAAPQCPPGTLIYCWVSTNAAPSPVRERRTVIARSGNLLVLDQPVDQRANVLKWFTDAAPIADVQEGSASVVTSRGQWQAGQSVLVTSGPEIANEAKGELRRVTAVQGMTITLDRPLRRGYSLAALARVSTVDNVVLRDLTIELPVNKQSESLYASLVRNWQIERCRIARSALGNCADVRFRDCDIGWLQSAASSHDISLHGCRIQSASFEEGCHDCTVDGCTLGPVQANMNCLSIRAQSERITVRNSTLLGGAWPSSQILMDTPGRECVFSELRMSGKVPCWLKSDRGRLSGILSDGDVSVTGSDVSRSQVWAANGRWGW